MFVGPPCLCLSCLLRGPAHDTRFSAVLWFTLSFVPTSLDARHVAILWRFLSRLFSSPAANFVLSSLFLRCLLVDLCRGSAPWPTQSERFGLLWGHFVRAPGGVVLRWGGLAEGRPGKKMEKEKRTPAPQNEK